jgi:hypothetical protein
LSRNKTIYQDVIVRHVGSGLELQDLKVLDFPIFSDYFNTEAVPGRLNFCQGLGSCAPRP